MSKLRTQSETPLVPLPPNTAMPLAVPESSNPITHSLRKRELKRQRETVEEMAKNAQAMAQAIRAGADVTKASNESALEAGRAAHVQPQLEAEETGYRATAAENRARMSEAEFRTEEARRRWVPPPPPPPPPDPLAEFRRLVASIVRGDQSIELREKQVWHIFEPSILAAKASGNAKLVAELTEARDRMIGDLRTGEAKP